MKFELIDITGQQFGRLNVIKRRDGKKGHKVFWICKCYCGKEVDVEGYRLRNGEITSCGCGDSFVDSLDWKGLLAFTVACAKEDNHYE